jgi:hypothetical protein
MDPGSPVVALPRSPEVSDANMGAAFRRLITCRSIQLGIQQDTVL